MRISLRGSLHPARFTSDLARESPLIVRGALRAPWTSRALHSGPRAPVTSRPLSSGACTPCARPRRLATLACGRSARMPLVARSLLLLVLVVFAAAPAQGQTPPRPPVATSATSATSADRAAIDRAIAAVYPSLVRISVVALQWTGRARDQTRGLGQRHHRHAGWICHHEPSRRRAGAAHRLHAPER